MNGSGNWADEHFHGSFVSTLLVHCRPVPKPTASSTKAPKEVLGIFAHEGLRLVAFRDPEVSH